MSFAQISNVSLAFNDRDILKNVSLRLTEKSKSCLTGANGSGKTTFLKIIAGIIKPDFGDYAIQKGARISYLPQSGIIHRGKTLREEMETAFDFAHGLIAEMDEIGEKLKTAKGGESGVKNLVEEHHNLQEKIEQTGFYGREAEIYSVLTGLGFSLKDFNKSAEVFSGGWQMRIALAKVLLEKPDILLLDEPTNYLDIEARNWLENWLNNFSGGYLLVSHDRYFLDVCVNEVYEIFNGAIKCYAGNYTYYEKIRQTELENIIKKHKEQQDEIEKTEALIRRFRYKASKAAFAQELLKRLDKMERVEIPESLKKINIAFPPSPHSGRIVLSLENISKSYGDRKVLSGLNLLVESRERIVAAGPNGAGKTTLLRIIAGKDPNYSGNVKYGAGVTAGYFSPDGFEYAAEYPDKDMRVIDYMEQDAPTALIPKLRDMLGAFLFRGDDVYKSLKVLSGGEKSRLALLKLLLKPLNLLILDEPTNHLDLQSKDILLDALSKFNGTVIFVSHDRYFMEKLSTKVLELPSAKLYYGNYAYYLERTNNEQIPSRGGAEPKVRETLRTQRENNVSGSDFKQKQAQERRRKRQEEELLAKLEGLEKQKTELEAELSLPEVYSNREKAKAVKLRLDECIADIDNLTLEWEKLER